MSSHQDLMQGLFGGENPETAADYEQKFRKQFQRHAQKLPPSEREKLNVSFDTVDGASGDDRLLIELYDLTQPEDRFRFETFAGRDEVQPVSAEMQWSSDHTQLVYMVMYHIPKDLYRRMRRPQIEDPTVVAVPRERDDAPPGRGFFENMGQHIDQGLAAVWAALTAVVWFVMAWEEKPGHEDLEEWG